MWKYAAVLIGSLALVCFSGQKLYKMAQIKGWAPGGRVATRVIAQKGLDPARRLREGDSYWVAFVRGDVTRSWADRHRVSQQDWASMRIGDRVEVVYIPGEKMPYLRNDIFVDPDNFVFDAGLVTVALAAALWAGCGIGWQLLRGSTADDAPPAFDYARGSVTYRSIDPTSSHFR